MKKISAFFKSIFSNEIIEAIGKIMIAYSVFDFITSEHPSKFTGVVLTLFIFTVFSNFNASVQAMLKRLEGIEKSNKNAKSYHDAA